MKIKNIEWRNIKSYGNKIQRIEFPDQGGLWMLLGKNGNGKSTLLELPKILYYGRLNDVKKEDIANRLNKHGWIRGEVEIKPGHDIIIERTFAPSNLTVYKKTDNEKIDIGKAGISNYQDYIDLEVTGLPYNIFSNVISLSINDFKSFISMSPKDKRVIIDKLFSMEIINKMYTLVRDDMKDVKKNIEIYDKEIISLEKNIVYASKELDGLKKSVSTNNTEKVKDISNKLVIYKNKITDARKKLETYKNKETQIRNSYNKFIQQKSDLNSGIRKIKEQLELYDEDKCPTCGTDFSKDEFSEIKDVLNHKLLEKNKKIQEVNSMEQKYKDTFAKLQVSISKLSKFIYKAESGQVTLNKELEKIKQDKPVEFESIKNIISKNKKEKNKKEDYKKDIDNNYQHLATLNSLYSDNGVKQKVLDNYLPTLNREIEYTLNELHFPYKLNFNNDFEPELSHLGIDINVNTLSTGEKKRVDLAVLISMIRMLKQKYPNLNTFMLDEVLSSIDGDGLYDIIGLLLKTAKDMNINIFIINFSLLPIEYFYKKIDIYKKDGFSDLEITNLE